MCMRLKALAIVVALAFSAGIPGFCETGNQLSFAFTPAFFMPFDSTPRYFTSGGGGDLSVEYQFPVVSFLGARLDVNGSYLPISTGDGCALFSVGAGPSIYLPSLGAFTSSLFGTGGYYYGVIADNQNRSGGNFFLAGGVRLGWSFSPSFNTGAEVAYRYAASGGADPLYQGLSFGLSARFTLLQASLLRIQDLKLDDVFPVLLKYYDTHSIGKVVFDNSGTAPLKDIEVSFFVDKYMDNPTQCPAPPVLNGGQKATIDLFGLFSEKVLSITESTVVSGKVSIAYTQENKRHSIERSGTLHLKDRNAITWEDTRKVAAFVLYKDPAVLEIAKMLARDVKESSPSIDENLSTAMALHEALRQFGIRYVVDPTSSYAELSKSKVTVDYIQYPRSTLQYRTGDCDDLSVLYTSILQGVGIDTAFITVPGHIFMAFALKATPDQARKLLSNPASVIVKGDKVWVPLEITMTTSDFLEAWNTGANEWNENSKSGEFIPVGDAWETYEPVGYFEDTRAVSFVSDSAVKTALEKELAAFADRELAGLKAKLEQATPGSANKPATLNILAVRCAQYGRKDAAIANLETALKNGDYYPALLNYGNLLYLDQQYSKSLSYYLRARRMKPDDAFVTLHLSQVYAKMGNQAESDAQYRRLASLDPELASRHADLDASKSAGARAAGQLSERETMIWQE